jgi:hypothetical protein
MSWQKKPTVIKQNNFKNAPTKTSIKWVSEWVSEWLLAYANSAFSRLVFFANTPPKHICLNTPNII